MDASCKVFDTAVAKLFEPVRLGSLELENRIVMAPMTRSAAPEGVPTTEIVDYYGRRAAAGVGLIITEGVWVEHEGASNDDHVPRFYGEDTLAGWARVVKAVHAEGGRIMPQLWHVGLLAGAYEAAGETEPNPERLRREALQVGPSGMVGRQGALPEPIGRPMTEADIDAVIEAFVRGGESAYRLGFDGVALHGGHGYLLDQFFWSATNHRTDRFGGSIAARSTFVAEIAAGIRRRTAPDFPIMLRFSQWKLQDYSATLVSSPHELEQMLTPLVDAGINIFDCSQRRFWEPAFEGSDLNLAAWTQKLTGKPTMTVGSVGLDQEMFASLMGATSVPVSLERLMGLLERGDFDLVGVGRALLVDPDWVAKVRSGRIAEAIPFSSAALQTLY